MQTLLVYLVFMLVLKHQDVALLFTDPLLAIFDILAIHLNLAVLLSQVLLQSLHLLTLVIILDLLNLERIVFMINLFLHLIHLLLHYEYFQGLWVAKV
jgi:hypothetical protein